MSIELSFEIKKQWITEHEAANIATIQRSDAASALHHVTATKDSLISPNFQGTNGIPPISIPYTLGNPWNTGAWPSSSLPFYIPPSKPLPYWG